MTWLSRAVIPKPNFNANGIKNTGLLIRTMLSDTPTNNVLVVNMKDYLSSRYSEDLKNFQSVSKIKTGLDNLDKTIGGLA